MQFVPTLAPQITISGVTLPLSQAIVFGAITSAGSRYCTLYKQGTQYQVPVGRTLYLVAVELYATSAAASVPSFGYGDNAVNDSVAAPTNYVQSFVSSGCTAATIGAAFRGSIQYSVAAGKYPAVFLAGPGACSVIGYLV